MIYLCAFMIGGGICALAELLKCIFKLTTGHMTVMFVCLGTLMDFNHFYERLIDIAGAGALLPITNFGHSLAHASFTKAQEVGFIGIFTGMYDKTAGGIAFTFILAVVIALISRPKS